MSHKDKFKIIVTIADIHLGNKAISHKEYKYQLKHGLIKKMEMMTFIDAIVICGDIFHYTTSLNSEYAAVFMWLINKLMKIARKHNAFIRFIKGTRSHDLSQLDVLKQYEDDEDIDLKVIDEKYIEVIDGHRYGYIPEEYISCDIDEYYSDFFDVDDNYFDMIFGHGMVKDCQFVEQENENQSSRAPIFDTNELGRICRGPISFGHIHTPMNIRNKFFYVGSILRTAHGEEHDKGWNVICYIKESGLYRVDKIVNEHVFSFNTLKLTELFISKNDIDNIISHIETFISKNNVDKLLLKVKCVDNKENYLKIELLKKYCARDKNITTNFKIMSPKAYERELEVEKNKITKSYLTNGLTIVEQVKLWAMEERNIKLEESDIEKYLTFNNLKRKGV